MNAPIGSPDAPRLSPIAVLLGALVVGIAVTAGGELLVGDASGGGSAGAGSVATDAALAGVVSLFALLLARRALAAAVVSLLVLTVLAALLAWYTAMAFVLGSTAFALSRGLRGRTRAAGTAAGVLGVATLLLFVVLVGKELLW